jgi:hypothetical protein
MRILKTLLIVTILTTGCSKDDLPLPQSASAQQTNVTTNQIIFKEFTTSFKYWNSRGVDINAPVLIDYNSNGKIDIIVSQRRINRVGNSYTYELLNPILILDDGSKIELTNLWKGGGPVTSGDFNGDGYTDIAEFDNGHEYYDLELTPDKTDLTIWWNSKKGLTGESTFADKILHNSYAIASGDLDGDGKDEIVRMDFPNYDNYFKYNGKAFNKLPINGLPNITNGGLIFNDINSDGKMDAISAAYGSPTIVWNFLNNTSKTKLDIPKGYGINNTVIADFDKDGSKDVIFICQKEDAGGQIFEKAHYYFYYKNTNGDFKLDNTLLPQSIPYSEPNCPMYVAKDLDGDGDVDFYNINSDLDAFFINQNGKFKRVNKFGYGL